MRVGNAECRQGDILWQPMSDMSNMNNPNSQLLYCQKEQCKVKVLESQTLQKNPLFCISVFMEKEAQSWYCMQRRKIYG